MNPIAGADSSNDKWQKQHGPRAMLRWERQPEQPVGIALCSTIAGRDPFRLRGVRYDRVGWLIGVKATRHAPD
jgi:hypothetical protein